MLASLLARQIEYAQQERNGFKAKTTAKAKAKTKAKT